MSTAKPSMRRLPAEPDAYRTAPPYNCDRCGRPAHPTRLRFDGLGYRLPAVHGSAVVRLSDAWDDPRPRSGAFLLGRLWL